MLEDLVIASINATGIKPIKWRLRLFKYLKNIKNSIICLQETSFNNGEDNWNDYFDCDCIFTKYLGIIINTNKFKILS